MGTASAIGKIIDNDQRPTISIDGVSASENQGPFVFSVKLSNSNDQPITVKYTTVDGTAIAGSDYTATSGTLTFAPTVTQTFITVDIKNDLLFEAEEQFFVQLSNPTNADLSTAAQQATGSIGNDDSKPTVSIAGVLQSQLEGTGATDTPVVFEVTLSNASAEAISVNFTTKDGTTPGASAIAPIDYKSISGTLTFNPGETKKQITVLAIADSTVETAEDFSVELSNLVGNAQLSPIGSKASVVLLNDDSPVRPSVSIEGTSKQEGATGATTKYEFIVRLSQATTVDVSVDYETQDGTATVLSNDYSAKSGTLLFKAGDLAKTVTVDVKGDSLFEAEESFNIILKNLSTNADLLPQKSQAQGVILNDDAKPILSITGSQSIAEGAQGETKELVFNVSTPNGSEAPITVNYTTQDGSAKAGDNDYQTTSGTLTFAPGQTQQAITVKVTGDNKYEPEETFTLKLANAIGADLSAIANQGTATILPDDFRPTVSISGDAQIEGSALTFIVKLSGTSSETISVNFATKNGTALDTDSDYVSQSGTLNFLPGELEKTITVQTLGDTRYELDETFTVELSNPSNTTLTNSSAIATIKNDDPLPQIQVTQADSKPEGDTGITPFVFVVSLSQASPEAITVNYSATDGTATLVNNDFAPTTGTLNFAIGETQKTVTVNVLGDAQFEQGETFQLALSNATKATISTQNSIATIQNDDRNPNPNATIEDSAFDVVLRNDKTGEDRFWYFGKTIYGGTTNLFQVSDPNWEIEAAADFNGDGNTDILWRNYQTGMVVIWKMNRDQIDTPIVVRTVADLAWRVKGVGDFNGDRKVDIVWRNSRTGETAIWLLNDLQYGTGLLLQTVADLSWDIVGVGDTNNNNSSDLIWRNNRTGENAVWQIENGRLVNSFSLPTVLDLSWTIEAVGDFNNDHIADLIWRHRLTGETAIWLLYNNGLSAANLLPTFGQSWEIEQIADFNNDSYTDILWRDTTTGNLSLWWMNGTSYGASVSVGKLPDLTWTIEGVGDFTGDRIPDILIRNSITGADAAIQVTPTLLRSTADLYTVRDPQWQIVGANDFDRDGQGDVLWRNLSTGDNVIWFMNGNQIRQPYLLPRVADLAWSIRGVADLDGDTFADLIWRNDRTGENAVWLLSAGKVKSWALIPKVADLDWQIEGVRDFSGDGIADLLWRNYRTGENAVWVMKPDGQNVAQYLYLPTVVDINWRIKGIGDFNNDGKSDLVWLNTRTGEVATWLMNGVTFQSGALLPTPVLGWDIVGIGDFNGDGMSDLLWRNATADLTAMWCIVNGKYGVGFLLPSLNDSDWKIRGVGDFKTDSV